MAFPSEEEIMYVVGLLEAEGCFNISSYMISCDMTDLDVLQKLHSIMGGKIYGPYIKKEKRKPSWNWIFSNKYQLQEWLNTLLPYMSKRRSEKIRLILQELWDKKKCLNDRRQSARAYFKRLFNQ